MSNVYFLCIVCDVCETARVIVGGGGGGGGGEKNESKASEH